METAHLLSMLRVGLVGLGAIGQVVADGIVASAHGLRADRIRLAAVLVRSPREKTDHLGDAIVTTDPGTFFGTDFDVCVECAGQSVVRSYASSCLRSGRNFLCTSIGALTDDKLMQELTSAATAGNSQLQLASGAMGGIDWMSSSALELGSQVTATQIKPPASWSQARCKPGTTDVLPDVIDFSALSEPTTFFEGTAREAASFYPMNSNILAMLAISTAGLDETYVRLVADPINTSLRQSVEYQGKSGRVFIAVEGSQSAENPRTSRVVPLSVLKALRNMSAPVAIGV